MFSYIRDYRDIKGTPATIPGIEPRTFETTHPAFTPHLSSIPVIPDPSRRHTTQLVEGECRASDLTTARGVWIWGSDVKYTPYEGPNLANSKNRKLGVFDRKLEGNHSIILSIF